MNKKFLYSAYRLSTIHLGPDGSQKQIDGTCFYVKSGDRIFMITNRHNVDLQYKDPKYVGYKIDAIQMHGYCDGDHYIEVSLHGHTLRFGIPINHSEDVFALELPKSPVAFRRRKKPGEQDKFDGKLNQFMIDIDMLASDDDLKKLSPGDRVLLPSYSAHYDKSSERPVMRGGIISSDPDSDYQTEKQEPARRVLFQAHSAEGASGGPVFALSDSSVVLLGVNAGHLIGSEPRIGSIHSGFSYCFKSTCIREAIDNIGRAQTATE